MAFARASEYRHVFEHFGVEDADREESSCYAYAPVFPALVGGEQAVIKRTQRTPGFAEAIGGWLRALRASGVEVVAVVRDADLPHVPVSLAFRACNLVYRHGVPILVDPDNAEYAPRLLDLALAALLFHNEIEDGPGRLFDEAEWPGFIEAYLRHVELTGAERSLWPAAVRYMLIEWGFWTLADAAGIGAWAQPAQRSFLRSLAGADEARFALPG